MSDLKQRVAYLQGLASGFNVAEGSREGQVLKEVLDVLDEMADSIARVEQQQEELEAYVESLDSDLSDLENDYYGVEDGEYDDEGEVWEVTCPDCGTVVEVEADYDDAESATCPECGAALERQRGGFAQEKRPGQYEKQD